MRHSVDLSFRRSTYHLLYVSRQHHEPRHGTNGAKMRRGRIRETPVCRAGRRASPENRFISRDGTWKCVRKQHGEHAILPLFDILLQRLSA